MRRQSALLLGILVLVSGGSLIVGQQTPPPRTPGFRSGINLVLVDVVVRDRSGAIVRGLRAEDFELTEDGVRQQILTFAFEDIGKNATPVTNASTLAPIATATAPTATNAAPSASETPSHPLTSDEVAGH